MDNTRSPRQEMADFKLHAKFILHSCLYSCICVAVFCSCRSMGPKTIPIDGFNYNERIAVQGNEQLLLNIVRLRYAEVPVFMNVNSMINQYQRQANVGANANFLPGSTTQAANISGSWIDRPTITFTPLAGQAFSRNLLQPLYPAAVFFLIQSGWSAKRIMRLTTASINGLRNERSTPNARRQADAGFVELLETMEVLQNAGILGLEVGGTKENQTIDVYFPNELASDSLQYAVDRFKALLHLNPDRNRFPIRYGLIVDDNNEIVMQSNSMFEILVQQAWFVDVPPEHVQDGRTLSTFAPASDPIAHIRFSRNRPEDAFVSIKMKDNWYYIDDRDLATKTSFGVLQILMSLAEESSRGVGPLISIGN